MSLNSFRTGLGHASKWLLGFVTLAMLVTAFTGIGQNLAKPRDAQSNAQANPDQPVATVNGLPITESEFEDSLARMKQMYQMYGMPVSPLTAGQVKIGTLRQLANQKITLSLAKAAGVVASQAEISKDRDKSMAALKTQLALPANATDDQVNQELQKYNRTLDKVLPVDNSRDNVILQKYDDLMTKTNMATEADLQQSFKSVHSRHILISNKTRPDAQAKQQAQDIIDQLKKGADFATLCKQHSDDPGTKNKGGDDGWINSKTGYVQEFLNAALALNKGQVTPEPILSPQYGYFVIQVTDVKTDVPKDLDKQRASLIQQLSTTKKNAAMQKASSDAQQSAKIVVIDPLLRAYWNQSPQPGVIPESQDAIIADFNKALATADYSTKGEIHAQLAQIYQTKNDNKDVIAQLNLSLQSVEDTQLRMMLGNALLTSGDKAGALQQFQTASANAYDNPAIHSQLIQAYQKMGEKDLIASEQRWQADYAKKQKMAQAAQPGGFGGRMPIRVLPNTPTKKKG